MSKKITKAELIAEISAAADVSKTHVSAVLSALEAVVSQMLQDGNTVTLTGLVKLTPKDRAARKVRNPSTGVEMMSPAKRVVSAKALAKLV